MACISPARLLHSRNSRRRKFRQRYDRCAVPGSERSVIRSRDSTAPIGCLPQRPRPCSYGPRAGATFRRCPNPTAAAFGPTKPTRHGVHRTLPLRTRPCSYGLRVCGSFGRCPSLRVAAFGQSTADAAWRPSGVTATALTGTRMAFERAQCFAGS
jgi:hypothetical protein